MSPSPRLTPAETARREDWVRYLAKQGYNQVQISKKLRGGGDGVSQSSIGNVVATLGIAVSRTRADLPMDPVDWRNDPVPGARNSSRLSRDGIITESLALLDLLEKEEALFRLATLAEEGELMPEQYGRLLRLREYLDGMCRAVRDSRFRAEIRRDPLRYRGRSWPVI